jgi:hypothetical protein
MKRQRWYFIEAILLIFACLGTLIWYSIQSWNLSPVGVTVLLFGYLGGIVLGFAGMLQAISAII